METRFWATKGFTVITRRMGFTSFFKSLFMLFLFLYIMELQRDAEMVHSISDVQSILTPIFDRYGISRAVLFGSVAKGTATAKSDLDLLVDSKLRGLKFVGFMEDVRQAAGMPVDVFDISHIEQGSLIDREIRSTGVTIYEK